MRPAQRRLSQLYTALFYRAFTELMRVLCFLFARRRVEGRENVPPHGPLLVASNHLSVIDPPLLGASLPRRLTFVAKAELYREVFLGLLTRGYGSIRLKRVGGQRNTLQEILDALARDHAVCMFPEGTRSRGGLARGKAGVAMIALRSGAPVLPVAIMGTEKVTRLGSFFRRPALTVRIGQPFTLPHLEGPIRKAQWAQLSDMIMERISALLPPDYRGYYGRAGASREAEASGQPTQVR